MGDEAEELWTQLSVFIASEQEKRQADEKAMADRRGYLERRASAGLVSERQAALDDVAAKAELGGRHPDRGWEVESWEDPLSAAQKGVNEELMRGVMELLNHLTTLSDPQVSAADLSWSPARLAVLAAMRSAALHVVADGPEPEEFEVGPGEALDPNVGNEASCAMLVREAKSLGRGIDSFTVGEGVAGVVADYLNAALAEGALARIQAKVMAEMDLAPGAPNVRRAAL